MGAFLIFETEAKAILPKTMVLCCEPHSFNAMGVLAYCSNAKRENKLEIKGSVTMSMMTSFIECIMCISVTETRHASLFSHPYIHVPL